MKTDKDMTENILKRVAEARAAREHRNHMVKKVADISCVFALIFALTIGFLGGKRTILSNDNNPTEQAGVANTNKGFFLMVANAANENEMIYSSKETNVKIPLGGILQIDDIKGMSKADIDQIDYELKNRLEKLYEMNQGFHIRGTEGVVAVHFGTADKLRFKVADVSMVDHIDLSCSDKGEITVWSDSAMTNPGKFIETVKQGNKITITAEEYKNYDEGEGVQIRWFLSEDYVKELDANTSLSEISDTIVGEVSYTDGTKEFFTINLNFDNEGILTSTYSTNISYYPIGE